MPAGYSWNNVFPNSALLSQRRWFQDYFTVHLPGSSLHPDPAPMGESGKAERATTTVRVPLHTAKQHFGASRTRGTRPRNEDNYQAGVIDVPPFSPPDPKPEQKGTLGDKPSVLYFGVFDGHGGDNASVFLKDHLHQYIEATSQIFNPKKKHLPIQGNDEETEGSTDKEHRTAIQTSLVNAWKDTVGGYFRRFKPDFGLKRGAGVTGSGGIGAVLTYAFLRADLDFITNTKPWFEESDRVKTSDEPANPFKGGSTASVVLVSTSSPTPFWNPKQTSTLVTAHLGDTRVLLCRVSDGKAVPLTVNHHPSSQMEAARLRRYAAAFVQDSFGEERFGVLANTRSIGDVTQKRLGVSAEPHLYVTHCSPGEYAFLVLLSDGITAVLGDQEVVDIVKECKTPEEAAGELTEFVDEVGDMGDNATAVVVRMGGWAKRNEGGEGWLGTKALREWRREEAEEKGIRRRM